MLNRKLCFNLKRLSVVALLLTGGTVQAASPLWTLIPASTSNINQTVSANGSATVQYVVRNQSNIAKKLVIMPTAGMNQTAPCQLAPSGKAGSQCILNLVIDGKTLPATGIQGGPVLCQANQDGRPNPNQCYRPSAANSLKLSKGKTPSVPSVSLKVNPSSVTADVGQNTDFITLTNLSRSTSAQSLMLTPSSPSVQLVENNCGNSLIANGSCQFKAKILVSGNYFITISAKNSKPFTANVSTSTTPQAVLTSSPTNLEFAASGTNQILTINNTSATDVTNLRYSTPLPNGITLDTNTANTTCTSTLAANTSCQYSFLPGSSAASTANIVILADNPVMPLNVPAIVYAALVNVTPNPIRFEVNSNSGNITISNLSTTTELQNLQFVLSAGSFSAATGTTCTANQALAAGESCILVLQSSSSNFDSATLTVSGNNSNTKVVNVNSTLALLSVNPLSGQAILDVGDSTSTAEFTVTNIGSITATNVQIISPWTPSGVTFSKTNCGDMAISPDPSSTCTFTINANKPNLAKSIIIQGDNATPVNTNAAFRYQGGLVFSISGNTGKVVTEEDVTQQSGAAIVSNFTYCVGSESGLIGAFDISHGENLSSVPGSTNQPNTGNGGPGDSWLMLNSPDSAPSCTVNAATACNLFAGSGQSDWYLPSICELGNAYPGLFDDAGCVLNSLNVGNNLVYPGFLQNMYTTHTYLSSTESQIINSNEQQVFRQDFAINAGTNYIYQQLISKTVSNNFVRCVRGFNF